jgi:serine/threonine protein kinase
LYDVIYKPRFNKKRTLFNVYKWLYQLVYKVNIMNSKNISHRDIKPSNIMLDNDDNIVLIDFSNSLIGDVNVGYVSEKQVTTSWYRPPEAWNLKNIQYGKQCDIWSIGCILFELLTRKPMFVLNEDDSIEYFKEMFTKRMKEIVEKNELKSFFTYFTSMLEWDVLKRPDASKLMMNPKFCYEMKKFI